MSKKHQIITVSFIFTIFFLAYRFLFTDTTQIPQEIKVVEVEKLALKDISQTAELIGTIKAKNSTILIAQTEGSFKITANSGQNLKKGDEIARIENLEVAKNYNFSIDAKTITEGQYERAKSLLKSGTYSKNELEELKSKWITAQKNLADAKNELNKLVFYAPFDGIVGTYKVKEGQQLKQGDKIVSFFNPEILTVDFDIPISILPNINNGQNLSILGKEYQLNYVQKMLDDEKHMSPASIDIACPDCVIGSNVTVDLNVIDKKQVIVIPFDAVFLKKGSTCVYTVENNKIILKPIELGIRNKELIEVTSGLSVGEEIVTNGTTRLWPDLDVKIHKENAIN